MKSKKKKRKKVIGKSRDDFNFKFQSSLRIILILKICKIHVFLVDIYQSFVFRLMVIFKLFECVKCEYS